MSQISVCHIASGDHWGGAEVQVATLLRRLREYSELQLSAIVLNRGRLAEELEKLQIDVKVIPQNQNSFRRIYSVALEFLQPRNVHVLHSHRYKENLLAMLLARQCGTSNQVRTLHGHPEPGGAKHKLVYLMDRVTGRLAADAVVSVSNDLTRYISTYIAPDKIAVIPNGIDLEQVQSSLSRKAAKKKLGLAEGVPVIGTVSRLEPVKRLDLFLSAAMNIQLQLKNAVFLVVGDGSQEKSLRSLIRGSNIEGRVHFLGHRDDVCDVMRAMDILLITSDREGLPLAVLEAMALGVPVVARKVGGISEVLEDEISGMLVSSSEPQALSRACVRVLRNETLKDRMIRAARIQVEEKFSATRNADEMLTLYRRLCLRHGKQITDRVPLQNRLAQ
jgi:glycosyltransferase involved in cell wall biosynthesis